MFVNGWKWYSEIKDGPLPSPTVLLIVVSLKKTLIEKKKTWLKNNKQLFEYVTIPGCSFIYHYLDERHKTYVDKK